MDLEKILKYVVIGGLFLVTLIPLFVVNSLFFPFITGKAFAFRIIIEIVFCAWILLAILNKDFLPKLSGVFISASAFVGIIVLAAIFSVDPYRSFWSTFERMDGLITLLHLGAFALVASSVFDKRLWNRFLLTSIIISVLISLYSLLQLGGFIRINQGGVRVDATLGNSIYLAVYLMFHIFLSLFFFFKSEKKQKYWFLAAIILESIILYFSASRGAILGLFFGLIITSVLILITEKERKNLRKGILWLLITIFVVVAGFLLIKDSDFVRHDNILGRFSEISFQSLKHQGRYFIWPMAIEGVKEKPILGYGPEGFQYVFNEFYNPAIYGQEPWFDRAHNIFLDWLVAGGILGLISFLALIATLIFTLWRSESFSKTEKSILIGLISAYLFQGIFVFDNLTSQILLFSIIGFVWSLSSNNSKKLSSNLLSNIKESQVKFILLPIFSVILISSLYFLNYRPLSANRNLIFAIHPENSAEQRLDYFKKVFDPETLGSTEALYQLMRSANSFLRNQSVSDETKQGFFILTKNNIEDLTKEFPLDVKLLLNSASFFNLFGLPKEAMSYLDKAKELAPKRPEIYIELGTVYFSLGEIDKAEENFEYAYNLEPRNPEGKIREILMYMHLNNIQKVDELILEIGDPLYFDDRILNAFAGLGRNKTVLEIWQKRVESDPSNISKKQSLVGAYILVGDLGKAIAELKAIIEIDPSFKENGEYAIKEIQAGRGKSLVQ